MKKIDYNLYPILKDIERGVLNLKPASLSDVQGFNLCMDKFNMVWRDAALRIKANVCYPCATYQKAVNMSAPNFDRLLKEEVFKDSAPREWVDSMEMPELTEEDMRREDAYHKLVGNACGCYLVDGSAIVFADFGNYRDKNRYKFFFETTNGYLVSAHVQVGEDYAYMTSYNPAVVRRNVKAYGENGGDGHYVLSMLGHTVDMLVMFERYAKIENRILTSKGKARLEMKHLYPTYNETDTKIHIRDSRYFTSVISNKEFLVRSHLRLQPVKVDGEWTRKLIFIDSFVKHGYHRQATIKTKSVC